MTNFQLTEDPTERVTDPASWREAGTRLRRLRDHVENSGSRQMWDTGDWLIAGEDIVFKNLKKRKIRQMAAEITGYSGHTLSMAVTVARKIEPYMRIDGLSWWHHQVVATLEKQEQAHWLTSAAEHDWSVRELRSKLHEQGLVSRQASRTSHKRLIGELTKLRLDEIDSALARKLHEWWQREHARGAFAESGQ